MREKGGERIQVRSEDAGKGNRWRKTGSLVKAREERKGSWNTECAENIADNGKTDCARARESKRADLRRKSKTLVNTFPGRAESNARFVRSARGREDAIQGQTANGDESREKTATMKTFGEER